MKKICRKLKLMKYGCMFDKKTLDELSGRDFMVCFFDGTYESHCSKNDLVSFLEQDHIKKISYIFDMVNRITISRDVIISTDEV